MEATRNGNDGGAPEWVKLLPSGSFKGRDGRGPFRNLNPKNVIDNTMLLDLEAGLPLDYDHAIEWDEYAPAAGWMKDFQVRDGAIFARVEWTDRGRPSRSVERVPLHFPGVSVE